MGRGLSCDPASRMMEPMNSIPVQPGGHPELPDHVLMQWQRLCLLAARATGAASVHVVETAGSNLVTRAAAGERASELAVVVGDCDRVVVATGEPLVMEDTAGDRRGAAAAAGGAGAYIGLPVVGPDGKNFGVIAGLHERAHLYTSADHEVFVVTAAALAHDLALLNESGVSTVEAEERRRSDEEGGRETPELFFASVVHELRTPLVSILGAAEAMLGGMAGRVTDSQQRMLEIIRRGGERMTRLVDNLRELVRAESGRFQVTCQRMDLREPVRQAMIALRSQAENAGVQLVGELPTCEVPVSGDADRLVQVALNLVENAIRHARRTVKVLMRVEGTMVEVIVADDGAGIPSEEAESLFAPWRRRDTTPGRATAHLGLGLTIVRHLVEAHGGSVQAVSPPPAAQAAAPTGGFACIVRLPLAH